MPAPTAEILSQGDEVVTGQIADTNAAWLSERLTDLGLVVHRHTAVGDVLEDIRDEVVEAAKRSQVVLGTGGLGPTDDDLTAEAVASALGVPLVHDEEAERQIRALYARFGRRMPEVNLKQARLPRGAVRIDNHWGTAPGFAVELHGAWLAFMPGVPREMKPMFDQHVLPPLRERLQVPRRRLVLIRTTGVGESDLQERIGRFESPGVVLSYRTILPENHVKLRFDASVGPDDVARVAQGVIAAIGSPVFAVEGLDSPVGGGLAQVVGAALAAQGHTLAVAESCTGGRLAAMCTEVPGASAWFAEGVVTYANQAKIARLGVSPATLEAHGAVSEPVARQMARGVREACGTSWGIGTTGIAGPGGGSEDKPVGTVHIAVSGPTGELHRLVRYGGDRPRIQRLAAAAGLDLLRRVLQGHLDLTSPS